MNDDLARRLMTIARMSEENPMTAAWRQGWECWFAWKPVPVFSDIYMRDGWRWLRFVERKHTAYGWIYKIHD